MQAPPFKSLKGNNGSGGLSIIAADVHIKGNVTTTGELQLDGTVDGDIHCGGIILGENGTLNGTITATTATIRGTVDGNLFAKTVILERTCRVAGDVTQESISIEAGAHVDGRLIHRQNPHEQASTGAEYAPVLKAIG